MCNAARRQLEYIVLSQLDYHVSNKVMSLHISNARMFTDKLASVDIMFAGTVHPQELH